MQPLPTLTEAQVKVAGPVQPAGRSPNPEVIEKLVAVPPSSVVNATLSEVLDPMATLNPFDRGVVTTESFGRLDVIPTSPYDTVFDP